MRQKKNACHFSIPVHSTACATELPWVLSAFLLLPSAPLTQNVASQSSFSHVHRIMNTPVNLVYDLWLSQRQEVVVVRLLQTKRVSEWERVVVRESECVRERASVSERYRQNDRKILYGRQARLNRMYFRRTIRSNEKAWDSFSALPLENLSLLSLLALLVQQYTYTWRRACARLSASREA